MNLKKYSGFRFLFWFLVFGGLFGWWGFVSMQNQVIEFYEEPVQPIIYDTKNDDSIQKYLGKWIYLSDLNYVPQDLVSIDSDFTANNARKFIMKKEAAQHFADLARHFWSHYKWDRLFITSAYRSASFQSYLIKKWCSRSRCAEVGASEHQLWLAIDIGVMTKNWRYIPLTKTSPYYQWLVENWADWWFHNTYQKWIDIDGQMEEAWHRRYLWVSLAQNLRDNNQTFSERYALQQTPDYLILDDNLL